MTRRVLRQTFVIVSAMLIASVLPSPATAQHLTFDQSGTTARPAQQTPPRAARKPRPPIGLHAYGLFDLEAMSANESFKAIFGSSITMGFGGGADITNLYEGLFMRVAFARSSKTGERGVIVDDEFLPNGIETKAKLTDFDIAAGWRIKSKNPQQKATPYVGGGLVFSSIAETDEFADPEDEEAVGKMGFVFFGGVDWPLGKNGFFGVEGQFRTVPNAIGESGVSAQLGETNLGGLVARVMIGFRK